MWHLRPGTLSQVAALSPTAAPPVSWTPDELGATVKGWWDASDTATITAVGANVTWGDKSSNANHVAHGGAGPSTGGATQNGLNVLVFNGSQALYDDSVSGLPSNSPSGVTMVFAGKITAVTSFVWTLLASGPVYGMSLRREATQFRFFGYQTGTHAAIADSNNFVLISGTATTALRQIFKNGTAGTSNSTTDSAAGTPVHIRVAGGYGFENLTAGQYGEVILLEGTGDTNRQLCEGYLAWKWGLVSDLDAGHPYKSAAPTV